MKICEQCGKQYDGKGKRFCSRQCLYNHGHRTLTCPVCKKDFVVRKSCPWTYCSRSCAASAQFSKPETRADGECEHCGKPFKAWKKSTQRYCSMECRKAAKQATTETTCPECGKVFIYYKSWPRIYCSRKCSAAVNARKNLGDFSPDSFGQVIVPCDQCGEGFWKRWDQVQKTDLHFCNQACFGKWMSDNVTGETHPLFKGGREEYYGSNWHMQRRLARTRDGYRCQHCGISQKKLERSLDVHHIIPFREFGIARYEEANHLSNLISLCTSCHKRAEHGVIPVQPCLI